MGKTLDLSENIYGYLTVLTSIPGSRQQKRAWKCLCICGNTTVAATNDILTGHTKSCGCKQFEGFDLNRTKHGYAKRGKKTDEYNIWCGIIYRCTKPNSAAYKYYGEKGVSICPQWRNSFETFLKDVGVRPSSKHSIDRFPNSDGNYEPGNVRWATSKEQNNNRANNIRIRWEGQIKTLAEWAVHFQVSYDTVYRKYKLFIIK